jgi:hypothetical protein
VDWGPDETKDDTPRPQRREASGRQAGAAIVLAVVVVAAVLVGLTDEPVVPAVPTTRVLFHDGFGGPDRLITNDFALYNPTHHGIRRSARWIVTSGSLFVRGGQGWTGPPDGGQADRLSQRATGSAVFRVVSRRSDFGNVLVSLRLVNHRFVTTPRTPARNFDGVHLILRWQSPQETYYLTVNRRDSQTVIRKKVPGGPANGGTYYDLTPRAGYPVPLGKTQEIEAGALDRPDGSVELILVADGRVLARAIDRGVGGPPIRAPGKVGLRGDNDDFSFDDFAVRAL